MATLTSNVSTLVSNTYVAKTLARIYGLGHVAVYFGEPHDWSRCWRESDQFDDYAGVADLGPHRWWTRLDADDVVDMLTLMGQTPETP